MVQESIKHFPIPLRKSLQVVAKGDFLEKYINSLITLLNSPAQLKILKSNPQIIQAYEEVLDIIELELPDEP